MEDAWERLDNKYAVPKVVTSTLIKEFVGLKLKSKGDASKLLELKDELETLYSDLKAVKAEDQVTNNNYLLNTAIEMIPKSFQEGLANYRCKKESQPGETLYKVLSDFLKRTVRNIEWYNPHWLDSKTENKS